MPLSQPDRPIRFYGATLSGHAHRVKLFLSLLGLPFETIEVALDGNDNRRPEYLAISPFGQVPAIVDGETVLHDSNAILVYLAMRYGDAAWLPRDPEGAAAVQRWLSLAAGFIFSGPCAVRLVTAFGRELDYDDAVQVTTRLLDVIEREFAHKRFALGEAPTIADVAAHTYIAHAPEGGVSLEPYPNVCAWLGRIEALDGFVPMPTTKVGLLA